MVEQEIVHRSYFTNIPVEYYVPEDTQVIFVADYFKSDLLGGAELTLDAIMQAAPVKIYRLHSRSVNSYLIEKNKDKLWVFGNYTLLSDHIYDLLTETKINYCIAEFDFKYCMYRSENLHFRATGQKCGCKDSEHCKTIFKFMNGARKIYWMSSKQRDKFFDVMPELSKTEEKNVVLNSVFDQETIDYILSLKKERKEPKEEKFYWILGNGSWIKGIEETKNWCEKNKISYKLLPSLPYKEFLKVLSDGYGLVFMPLDHDTCPRLTIEAKMLGLDVLVNDNVLHGEEDWFACNNEEILIQHVRNGQKRFWDSFLK